MRSGTTARPSNTVTRTSPPALAPSPGEWHTIWPCGVIAPGDVFWDYSEAVEYRYQDIATRFGAQPERMADYLALRGDSVDNVPGVPGVGAKTAAALMMHCASIDQLFEQLDAIARLPLRGAPSLPAPLLAH